MPISTAPLARKLHLRSGMRGFVLGAPKGFALEAPPGTTLSARPGKGPYDFGLAFARDTRALAKAAPALAARVDPDEGWAWLAWPKKTGAIETDLSRDGDCWEALWDTGWEGVSLVSLDDDWSAWRIRPSPKVKRNERATKAIAERDAARATPIDAYLDKLPPPQRAALQEIRRIVRAAAPDATEAMSYQIPTFKRKGKNLVHMAAFKAHLSFFPGSGALTEKLAKDLAGYKTAKGTIQFTVEKPLPAALVRKIVRMRIREQDEA